MANAKKDAVEKLHARVEEARRTAGVALREVELAELAKRCEKHELGKNANGWVNPYPKDDPRNLLLEYQFAWAKDESRFKDALQSRQSGKDFASECEAAEDCNRRPKTEWMIAAPSERQALDSLEQGKTWAQAFDLVVADYKEAREGSNSQTLLKSAEIIFSNGSRMRAVPGKPETVRGRSANILATEVDFFESPMDTWRALLPSITNPLRGGEKKVRLISTPNGMGGLMYKIRTQESKRMKWSHHLTTIYHAVLMGLPVDIEELKEAFADPDGWAQEFCCQFLDAASVLLPYELLALAESAEGTESIEPEYWRTVSPFPVDLGIDFGRKKDLTVCWAEECVADLQISKEVLCLEKMPTPNQIDVLRPRIQKARRVCLDYTGPGVGMGDYLVKEFGEWNPDQNLYGKIELVTFGNTVKVDVFGKLRMAYERRQKRIPVNVTIREDLHSIYRCVTPNGNVTFRAPHSEDGHADRASAQALCTRAHTFGGAYGKIIIPSGRRAEAIKGRRERSFSA
jgi:phage FluMu gp28-like protein